MSEKSQNSAHAVASCSVDVARGQIHTRISCVDPDATLALQAVTMLADAMTAGKSTLWRARPEVSQQVDYHTDKVETNAFCRFTICVDPSPEPQP